ncbi:ABC transporter ATP-binding protein [Terrimonas sp.]|uniref:ABC transporter ATP-binding protein n=1 Tax=Terrimonas sp. TaxID=1914338 RepID=UPI000D5154B1|nr:ATP-binding cassette domain-containing protein [Terrimonas sp.]PVD52580.1 ABC transporter ATP-binding protein [Terrimonas sp.]
MKISLTNTGKRFNRDWIFRHINFQFVPGMHYAITGSNGSGKSTLLQVISGAIAASEGAVGYELSAISYQLSAIGGQRGATGGQRGATGGQRGATGNIGDENYRYISIAAPYLELVEEMTLKEFLQFHSRFKPLLPSMTIDNIIQILTLEAATNKQIRYFSSGMKQRVKLAQAFFSDTPVLLLDEPCTNLDADGISLYHQLVNNYCQNRLVIVSSNDQVEYSFCKEIIRIGDFKK